jgi:hypothetical protein
MNLRIHSFWWRIHKFDVGKYTVFTIGNPLRKSRIHSFLLENTQVWCWRIHSFYYRKSLKELENTQFFWRRIHKFDVGEYTVFTIGNPLRNLRIHSFWWRIHKFDVGEYTVFTIGNPLRNLRIHSLWRIHKFDVVKRAFFHLSRRQPRPRLTKMRLAAVSILRQEVRGESAGTGGGSGSCGLQAWRQSRRRDRWWRLCAPWRRR